jgi:hypothetical protein
VNSIELRRLVQAADVGRLARVSIVPALSQLQANRPLGSWNAYDFTLGSGSGSGSGIGVGEASGAQDEVAGRADNQVGHRRRSSGRKAGTPGRGAGATADRLWRKVLALDIRPGQPQVLQYSA